MMLKDISEFKKIVDKTVDCKINYENHLKLICTHLQEGSSFDYRWYFNGTGVLQVDVPFESLDEYMEYVECLVGCKYTTERNLNGVTVLITLSTLQELL